MWITTCRLISAANRIASQRVLKESLASLPIEFDILAFADEVLSRKSLITMGPRRSLIPQSL